MSSISFSQVALTTGIRRQLDLNSQALSGVFERLSSGQRINRAVDDAAGLSVSSALNVKSRIFGQAMRNLSDGVSLLSIADQALGSLSDIVQRQRELAEQSANGTLSAAQREALDTEAQALALEYSRIVETTYFNGLNLLNGDLANISLKAGIGENSTLDLEILREKEILVSSLQNITMGGTANAFSQIQFLKIEGSDGKDTLFALSYTSNAGRLSVSVSSYREDGDGNLALVESRSIGMLPAIMVNDITSVEFRAGISGSELRFEVDVWQGALQFTEDYVSDLDGTDGAFGVIAVDARSAGRVPDEAQTTIKGNFTGLGGAETITAGNPGTLDFEASLLSQSFGLETLGQQEFSLLSQSGSLSALDSLKENLTQISDMRGRLGAMQSRVAVAHTVLSSQSEESRAASSRIQDADISLETSRLLRLSILRDAGAAVLAQASRQGELALLLLQTGSD